MKIFFLFILLLQLISCGPNPLKQFGYIGTDCPSILFSKEHKVYMGSSSGQVSLNNIDYRAEINNANFIKGCRSKDNIFSSDLSILFVVDPLSEMQQEIKLPFYIAIIDQDKILQSIEYYSLERVMKKDYENDILLETEISSTIKFKSKLINKSSILVIGFMLDDKRIQILN